MRNEIYIRNYQYRSRNWANMTNFKCWHILVVWILGILNVKVLKDNFKELNVIWFEQVKSSGWVVLSNMSKIMETKWKCTRQKLVDYGFDICIRKYWDNGGRLDSFFFFPKNEDSVVTTIAVFLAILRHSLIICPILQ